MIRTYIVDDEPHAIAVLKKYIEQTPGLLLQGFTTSPQQALAEISVPEPPDLAFVDVDMPLLSGLELAGLINTYSTVIFTTSFREYGPEAFEKNALDYLLKPISYERFSACIQKFRNLKRGPMNVQPENAALFVNSGVKKKFTRILPGDLIYVKGEENYVRLFLTRSDLLTYLTLQELLAKLPGGHFLRIHKSYVINLDKIREIGAGEVTMENGQALPIGKTYHDRFYQVMRGHILSSKRDQR